MRVFPAVDILGGRCVQLVQGDRETATDYGDPVSCAGRWVDEGADALHIVNLDGAFGTSSRNADAIRSLIRKTGVFVQLGGGIRSVQDARSWLAAGVNRVILGTISRRDPGIIRELVGEFGSERVMAGVDAKNGQIAIEGWQKTAGDYIEWARRYEREGAGSLLYTNIDREGLCRGVDPDPVRRIIGAVRIPVIVAGGITSLDDLRRLRELDTNGAVLGSALYNGMISLSEAIEVSR
jgi:phosphoribosylformimino-5-aminoimidazole carboxamide ribotide isomerase